jgi:hypothetical protein
MKSQFGAAPENIHAAIGPAIGKCCYEVGPEVALCFQEWFPERSDLDQKTHIDLAETIRRMLCEREVPANQIYLGAPCTSCSPADLESYRRDGAAAGRMITVIGMSHQA